MCSPRSPRVTAGWGCGTAPLVLLGPCPPPPLRVTSTWIFTRVCRSPPFLETAMGVPRLCPLAESGTWPHHAGKWTVLPLLPQAPGQASADTPQGLSMGTTSRGDKPTTRPQLRGRHCPLGATRWEPGMAKHPLGSRGAALSTPHTGAPARLRRAGVDETLVGGMAGGQMAAPTSRPAGIWLGSGQLTPQALQGPNLSALGSGQLLSGAHGGRAWVCYSSPRQVDMGPPSAALCHSQRDGLFQGLCGLIWPLRPPPWHSGDGR